MSEPDDAALIKRRKRLLYQCHHRGTQEADLLIGGFATASLARLTTEQLDRFECLLDENDVDLVNWITGRSALPEDLKSDVFILLKNFKIGPVTQ